MAAIRIDIDDLRPLLEKHMDKFSAAIRSAVKRTCLEGLRFVTKERLSYSKSGPPQANGLRVQTGSARRSVDEDVTIFKNQDLVVGRFGSPLDYVRAHELGFSGKVQVPAHTRRLVSLKRSARTGKVTKKSAKAYKSAVAAGRKTSVQVRAHSRQVNMAARRFFRDTLAHVGKDLPKHAIAALRFLAQNGFAPKAGSL